ncbi:MAG: bifunctional riboflavin kinase/FAD synthetase [Syntrophales bacterium]|jgi:riboflavin kinase/FMN adenylyltransferase|nr:bifunctional riboflavin kinase/FAD synthetase [Syntrophales bacterium]MCK9390404.1 bifunctional riboflavin kinase/FAD synthetase [Syntrophales bacterium]
MKTIHQIDNIPDELTGSYLTIGNFDGVHKGHQFLFRHLVDQARNAQRQAVVLTFDPHPKMVLHPDRRPFYLITSIEEKIRLIEAQGVDGLIIIPFNLDFSKTTAREFVCDLLWGKLRIKKILIGHDYTFGKGKEGNETFLIAQGQKLGFEVEVMRAFQVDETIISSTLVRNAILAGDVKAAAAWLGRPYNLVGRVVPGHNRGAGLGFPTANIEPEKALVPAPGVYAALARIDDQTYGSVLNIGMNPTFDDNQMSIEVHILDFKGDIYGKTLEILFIEKLREEKKFNGPAELIVQIRKDIEQARKIIP